ncbi:hypothetical protein VARIO8X_50208 [Burkholderiales bacterium 8X]|nr:hypothetical protein VARIO8X_50208 [Burkholderiales bacterium 8X]
MAGHHVSTAVELINALQPNYFNAYSTPSKS